MERVEQVVDLKVRDIRAAGNYRTSMDKKKMEELTASVKARGVLTPIWVRVSDRLNGGGHLIIAGHRRHQAATLAGLTTIPAIVKVATDEQALELSVIENTQREDPNPMEEALGFDQLLKMGKHTPETLADKLGKKVPYVLGRLKLLAIPKEAQKALLAGEIEYGHALLITRLKNNGDQKQLLEDILDEGMSVKDANNQLNQFSTKLTRAAFDTKTCTTCPARTKNQAALFPEAAKETDNCLDESCFFTKTREHYQTLAKAMSAKGLHVCTDEKSTNTLRSNKTSMEIELDPSAYHHPKKYKSMCATCEKRAFFFYEQKQKYAGGRSSFEHGEICLDKKCLNVMNGHKDYSSSSSSGSSRSSRSGNGASRQHAIFMRDRFLRSRVPPRVLLSETLQLRLVIFHVLCRFDKFGGQGRTDLKMDHDQVFKELMKEICPSWKPEQYVCLGEQRLYAAVATIPEKQLGAVLRRVILASVPHTDEEVLLQITPEAGIVLEKDFLVDETYLNTLTKSDLVGLAKSFGIRDTHVTDTMKKADMIAWLLGHKLTGKVPPAVAKECKIVTLGTAKRKGKKT